MAGGWVLAHSPYRGGVGGPKAMSFYASRQYLEAAAEAFFPGRPFAMEDFAVGDAVLRLLTVDGKPVPKLPFLDYHTPQSGHATRKLSYLRHVAKAIALLDGAWPTSGPNDQLAPFVDWSQFATFESYKARLLSRNKGLVKDRERRLRALCAQHGEIVFTADDRADDVLPFARHWKSAQLVATGHPDYFADPKTLAFFAALRARDALTISTLRAGGALVAVWIGFIHEGVWSGWVFTYDPAFKKFSAGHQLVAAMLEESFARGHREFDFSEGAEDYKLLYATHARLLGELGHPPFTRALIAWTKSRIHAASPKLLKTVQELKLGLLKVSHGRL